MKSRTHIAAAVAVLSLSLVVGPGSAKPEPIHYSDKTLLVNRHQAIRSDRISREQRRSRDISKAQSAIHSTRTARAQLAAEAQRREAERLAQEAAANAAAREARERAEVDAARNRKARQAPTVTNTGVWDRLAQCESGGNWQINTGNGYYGGLQFSSSSWHAVGGSGLPHQHSREEQIRRGQRLQSIQGWGAWPSCSKQLGLR